MLTLKYTLFNNKSKLNHKNCIKISNIQYCIIFKSSLLRCKHFLIPKTTNTCDKGFLSKTKTIV